MDRQSTLKYQTKLFINDCIEIIISTPWEHTSRAGLRLWYECIVDSYTQLRMTFKNGQFVDTVHSQYAINFQRKGRFTHITMNLVDPSADQESQIPESTIDCFLKERIGAVRIFTE